MMELVTARDAIAAQFEAFRTELDEHHDRRERLIKVNRVHITCKRIRQEYMDMLIYWK